MSTDPKPGKLDQLAAVAIVDFERRMAALERDLNRIRECVGTVAPEKPAPLIGFEHVAAWLAGAKACINDCKQFYVCFDGSWTVGVEIGGDYLERKAESPLLALSDLARAMIHNHEKFHPNNWQFPLLQPGK